MRGHIKRREWKSKQGKTTVKYHVVIDLGRKADGSRNQISRGGFKRKGEAEAHLVELLNELNTGQYVADAKTTVKEYLIDLWLPAMTTQVKPSTLDSYRRMAEQHVVTRIGRKPLQAVTSSDLNKMYAELLTRIPPKRKAPLSSKTVHNIHLLVSKMLGDAVRDGLVNRNVASLARPPKHNLNEAKPIQCWSAGQLRSFLWQMEDERLWAAFYVAAYTGMRRGEVLGLRWEDVDFVHQRVSVRQGLTSIAYKPQFSTPKSGKSRVIDIDDTTVEVLRGHRRSQKEARLAFGPGYTTSDLVFTAEDGKPVHPDLFTGLFNRLVKRTELPRIRLHDLRHTHATIALRAGVPVKVVSERLGHATPSFTMTVYQHVMPGMQAEAAAQIAALIAGGDEDEQGNEVAHVGRAWDAT